MEGGVTEPASLWSISKWHKRVLVELVVGRLVSKDNTLEPPDASMGKTLREEEKQRSGQNRRGVFEDGLGSRWGGEGGLGQRPWAVRRSSRKISMDLVHPWPGRRYC